MDNHYHLLVETPDANLSRGMQHLNGVYTQCFNRRHSRHGHLVQDRFKSILVEKESYILELARDIVLNPVRAKMVRAAKDWKWSSYRATAGHVNPPEFLKTDWLLLQFNTNRAKAVHAYRCFVSEGKDVDVCEELSGGFLMGGEAFVQSLRPLLEDIEGNREIRRAERLAVRPSLHELFANVTDRATRNERIHEAVHKYQYKLREVGDHLGLCYSTISVIAKQVEESTKS